MQGCNTWTPTTTCASLCSRKRGFDCLLLSMDQIRRKSGDANRYVLCATWGWRAVANALPAFRNEGLTRIDICRSALVLNLQCPVEDNGKFVELRCLRWFTPTGGTSHSSDADTARAGVQPTDELLNDLWLISCSRNLGG